MKTQITDYNDFFEAIYEQKGIVHLWQKVLQMLENLDPSISKNILILLCIYFSFLDDGNTCLCLDKNQLLNKWTEKWDGLLLVSGKENLFDKEDFETIIENGINDLLSVTDSLLIEPLNDSKIYTQSDIQTITKPFLIKNINGKKWLFASKYFGAKLSIEDRIKQLFLSSGENKNLAEECNIVTDTFEKITFSKKQNKPITLNQEQATAIVRGRTDNLIITGGPGTGKTTAICFLLWELLNTFDSDGISYLDYNLYLAAPSGKAAERMKESISDNLNNFIQSEMDKYPEIVNKLTVTDSSTIHQLLSYNPGKNGFTYNKDNQFEKKSIFIIDEASMIDIHLFRCLLEAIPDGARVFILGDKDQLPSVQAGAVLGELLGKKKDSVVELIISNRFNQDSQVGKLKDELQQDNDLPEDMSAFGLWLDSTEKIVFSRGNLEVKDSNPVFFYSLKEMDKANGIPSKSEQINQIISKWSEIFCKDITQKALLPEKKLLDEKKLKEFWDESNAAKILCAEREGIRGVSSINKNIVSQISKETIDEDGYYLGQLLILTKNQKIFRLHNGDTGIVVALKNDEFKYLMVEKKASEEEKAAAQSSGTTSDSSALSDSSINESGIFRCGDFLFYPLYLLPKDSIETAYAITIHKSQGSGYKNIMIFLPEQEGHPLLNRQIVYTAVTRTEGKTYVIASRTALNYSKKTKIERDTMIEID